MLADTEEEAIRLVMTAQAETNGVVHLNLKLIKESRESASETKIEAGKLPIKHTSFEPPAA